MVEVVIWRFVMFLQCGLEQITYFRVVIRFDVDIASHGDGPGNNIKKLMSCSQGAKSISD